MFALSDARDYSFSKVPYLEREEKITDQSNSRKLSELSKVETRKLVEILSRKLAHHPLGVSSCTHYYYYYYYYNYYNYYCY